MGFDYTRSRATAERLLARFGQRAVLRKAGGTTGPAYDPTAGEPWHFDVTVVDLDQKMMARPGTLTGTTTRTLLISTEGLPTLYDGTAIAPERGDDVLIAPGSDMVITSDGVFAGASHELGEVRPLAPGGVVVMWEADILA